MSTSTATRIQPAFADPAAVVDLIRSAGPFWPLANYAGNDAEMAALGSRPAVFVPPWFRQDFVREGVSAVDGADLILDNPNFRAAAHAVYGADSIVRPTHVYVNIMGPTPVPFIPHTDVPAFRGFTRADQPIWLLKVMRNSNLFEQWRTRIATAVSWIYEGEGGDFHYWPDGADGVELVESPPFANVSVVADNESTFHGAVLSHIDDADARITVSWKADVYRDLDEQRAVDEAVDALTMDRVVSIFQDDLEQRGIVIDRPDDAVSDEAWVATIAATYPEGAPRLTL